MKPTLFSEILPGNRCKNIKGSAASLPFKKEDKLLCREMLTQPIHTRMSELGFKG
jgi:hypothetical protein